MANKFIQDCLLIVEYDDNCNPTDIRVLINDKFEIEVASVNTYAWHQLKAAAERNEKMLASWRKIEDAYFNLTNQTVKIQSESHADYIVAEISKIDRDIIENL